ncbi:unnamed protein product [Schistosoma margrebowiei]|uniref:K Homology domain-containing protein n=1 Tax=Schistosoma margrebowiei TaxID=48269 RepID=A0AA84Z959_9TREM|nr:unnamed protein product [Schistosoma margrebowiei]
MEACAAIMRENVDLSSQLNEQDFPALPKAGLSRPVKALGALIPSYQAKTTEVLEIPFEERRFVNNEDDNLSAGRRYNVQSKICMEIARDTNVEMNLNSSKNHILTVVISGEPSRVAEAKRRVVAELQQQETVRISVPVECRGYLIGRKGERLQELESSTMTRISIPPHNALDPNVVIVTGPRRGILKAEGLIYEIVRKQSQQAFERFSIPKIYHPFICGPNNQIVNDLKSRTDTKINIPPPNVSVDEITVSGKREGVAQAVKEIQAIYNERLETTKTITVKVARSQHRIIFGQRGSGIADILAQTGVSVELPVDDGNEEIVLRGKPEDLGRALTMVYERAQSTMTEEIEAPNRFHRLLIGRGGSKLTELLEGYKRVQVSFGDNTDRISVEGPCEEVEVIVERLKNRLAELQATVAMAAVKVDPKYYRHIIGKQGATIGRLRDYKVRVRLPDSDRGDAFSDEIVIEGDPVGVEKAKLEIQQLVERLENEKCKDVIIDPHIQNLLRSTINGTSYIRTIYETFPQVRIIWPENDANDSMFEENPTKSIVQLRGDRQQVDAASEKLNKLIKLVKEENYRQEIYIFKEVRSSFLGREYPRVRKILEDTQTRLQNPSVGSNPEIFTVIGREENVRRAIEQLEELQKKLATVKEVTVSIPSALTTKFAGDQAPSLRSICEQCEGVHIRFANNNHNKNTKGQANKLSHMEIIVLGPEKEVQQACALLDQLNARVSQLCAEEIVHANPRFHGILIGRHASNITQFRRRHNVELVFPDRFESDPKLACEIRIVGTKSAVSEAKRELEDVLKSLEDEVEKSIPVDPSILKGINQYRRNFPNPDLETVRVIMPRYNNHMQSNPENSTEHSTEPLYIKLIGSKACVETAAQILQQIIKDMQEQIVQEFPFTDPSHISVLERNRSHLPELERLYRVQIRFSRSFDNSDFDSYSTFDERPVNQSEFHPVSGILVITGVQERINQVFEEGIKPLLPIEETFPVPQEFHRNLIVTPSDTTTREQSRRSLRGNNNSNKRNNNASDQVTNTTAETLSKAMEIKQKHSVNIRLPPQHTSGSDYIFLRGTPANIEAAKADLTEWLQQCELIKADKIARSYETVVEFPFRFLSSILSMRADLCSKHDVGIRVDTGSSSTTTTTTSISNNSSSVVLKPSLSSMPEHSSLDNNTTDTSDDITFCSISKPTVEDNSNNDNGNNENDELSSTGLPKEKQAKIILRGYQEHVSAAKIELENTINKLLAEVTENLFIPVETHARLIGARGNAIQKVMRDYNVRIEFPSRRNINSANEDGNTVLVTGAPENVDQACDYLISKANEFIAQSGLSNTRQRLFEEEI